MNISMDSVENNNTIEDLNVSGETQNQLGGESAVRPTLSQVKKSWGFRRTTIARREFMDEIGDLCHSPPLLRKSRKRKTNQTPQNPPETQTSQSTAASARSVLEDLQWSAPSSPISYDSKPASEEVSVGGTLDPSSWEDFGSAFQTAFSLLGGNEGLSLTMPGSLASPDISESNDAIDSPDPQTLEKPLDNIDDMEIIPLVAPDNAAEAEINDVVLISSQEEDSDDLSLMQIKEQLMSGGLSDTKVAGGKGAKGKAKGRGRARGRGRGRGKGRGKGRAVELQLSCVDDDSDDVILFHPAEQQHLLDKEKDAQSSPLTEVSPAHFDIASSLAQQSGSDCIIIDSDPQQIDDVTAHQFDDAPEEEEKKKDAENTGEYLTISDPEGLDSDALCCVCQHKQNKRFMISCDSCCEWFHGDCVGISETDGHEMWRKAQDYICPPCTTKKQTQLQSESPPQQEPEILFPECLTHSPLGEEGVGQVEQLAIKENIAEQEVPAAVTKSETVEMETDSTFPLCIGPGCPKQALPDSVYCGTECILQHAAAAMKTLTGPKLPKSAGRGQRKAATARPTAKTAGRMSKRLAEKTQKETVEEKREDDGEQEEETTPVVCDPSVTEAQTSPTPPSMLNTASDKDNKTLVGVNEAASSSKQSLEDSSANSLSQSAQEEKPAQSPSHETINSEEHKLLSADSDPAAAATTEPSTTSPPKHPESGSLIVTKTTYVIPKKQSGSQSPSSQAPKPPSAPTLLNESRNLPVSPAPSAPSSRPSQPNNQVRQSIQRSLSSILFKRVCDCEDLEMSESDVAKLVASIEMEMFDIFRNTDSKYMNKYRTIMFNLKDPRNKGLLYRVVRGEIGPFRLVRMSQKDMQATKAPEPSTTEKIEVKDATAKVTSLQKPEAVKVDLPSLNPTRPEKRPERNPESTVVSQEQKRSLPVPASTPKTRMVQPNRGSAVPDILSCMLKDTTSEHKAHLFDLKCKICTGQIQAVDEEEPAKKKSKVSLSREKPEPSWRKYGGDESPLQAPPDSPDMDSPSRLIIDAPALTIAESPASPVMDSPASPTLESPASPTMESSASPSPVTPKATPPNRTYAPVMIPAVSTVTITRRDPRTAASRFFASCNTNTGPSNTSHTQATPYAPVKDTSASHTASSLQPPKTLPKSILMKPSSTADPRLYGSSSRAISSDPPADGDTAPFLAKQDIMWKGFLNMLTVAKFVTKGYLVSGSAENLKADLPDTIQIGGRILPQTVWDYVAKLKTSVTKELCVIRFHPATDEEDVAYVSLFSYFSSRGRFGVVANISRSIKDVYLVPLSAKESIPSILQPLEGPGLEKNRPNLLLGLAIVQKAKRPGSMLQETEEKRPKVLMPKDPMWIPKPPVLYGSDKLEIFQPYDPKTPSSTTPPASPSCPGSPSDSSSSGSVTIPSLLTSVQAKPPVSTSASIAPTQSASNNASETNPSTESSDKTPLQAILKTLFPAKQSESTDTAASTDGNSTKKMLRAKKTQVFSRVSGSMMDPIVQQYGQKSKVKEIQEEENEFDRPYDPEEEYDPAVGYEIVAPQATDNVKLDGPSSSLCVGDDVAYDPEDETIFEDIQSDITVTKTPVPTQPLDPPVSISMPAQTSTPAIVQSTLPSGTVVVSAATLSEQQRMLEELNKQIEEQKRQLKEQEEALRQQREAVGMFMAHFSVSDTLMSPPSKSLPVSSLQSGIMQTLKEPKPSESTEKASVLTETVDSSENNTETAAEQDETQENVDKCDNYSSAGEIEDSDVAYDPEDESLFNEIQEDVFKGVGTKNSDHIASPKDRSPNSRHSRKRRSSPKRRSQHDRDRHRSPSRRSHRRSTSRSRRHRDRDKHRRSERDRSRHRAKEPAERQGRHRKDHTARRHSRGSRGSSSSSRKNDSVSFSPEQHREPFPQVSEKQKETNVPCSTQHSVVTQFVGSNSSSSFSAKKDQDGHLLEVSQKGFSPERNNFKPGSSELPKSEDLPSRFSVRDHSNADKDASIKASNPSPQDTLLKDKIESTVPLRELDPPIRDSPQSPDPEPQFVKPSEVQKSDYAEVEKLHNVEEEALVSMPSSLNENNCLSFSSQSTISSKLCFTLGDTTSNVRNIGIGGIGSQLNPGLNNLNIMSQVGRDSNPSIPLTIKRPRPETDTESKHLGPEMNIPMMRNAELDIKNTGYRGPQMNLSEAVVRFQGPGVKGTDIQGMTSHMGPSQDNCGIGLSDRSDGLRSDRGQTDPNRRNANIQGGNNYSPWPERKHEQMDREQRDITNITSPDWRGAGPGIVCPSEPDRRNDWRRQDRKGSDITREETLFQDELKVHQSDRRRLNMDSHRLDRRDAEGTQLGPEISGPNIWPQKHDSRGPGNPDFTRAGFEMRGSNMHDPRFDSRQPEGHERRNPNIQGLRPDNSGPGLVIRGQDLKVPMQDMRGHPDFTGQGLQRIGPTMDSQGPGFRAPGAPGFVGGECEITGLAMEGPVPDRRGPVNPDFRATGPDIELPVFHGQGPNMTGLRDHNFNEPWSEMKGLDVVGPDRRGPGGPDFIGPGPERRGMIMEGPRTDRGGFGGPDFRGPAPERRDTSMGNQEADRIGLRGPDFRGSCFWGAESERDLPIDGAVLESRRPYIGSTDQNIIGLGPERTGPDVSGPGPQGRKLGGPHFREGPGPDRRGADIRGPLLERQSSVMEIPLLNRTCEDWPTMGRPGLQQTIPNIEGPGPNRRGSEGTNIKESGLKRRPSEMENMHRIEGPEFRGEGPDRTGMEGQWPIRNEPGGPDFRGPGCQTRGPDCEGPDRQEPRGPGFRKPWPERRGPDMEAPVSDWRRSDFRGPGVRQGGPNKEGLRHNRVDNRGESEPFQENPDRELPGSNETVQTFKGPRPMRTNFRGPDGLRRPDFQGFIPDTGHTDNNEQWSDRQRGFSEEDWEMAAAHGSRNMRPFPEDTDEQGQEHSIQGHYSERNASGHRGPGPMQERPNIGHPGPIRGTEDDWDGRRGPGPIQEDSDMVSSGSGRRQPGDVWRKPEIGRGSFFRGGERNPHNRGRGYNRGQGQRPGSDIQGHPDTGNEWRQSDFRGNMRGPNTEGCNIRGPEMNSVPNWREPGPIDSDLRLAGPGNRSSSIESLGSDGRDLDVRQRGPERCGVDIENSGHGRQEFEPDFRRERRGPRHLGPNRADMRRPSPKRSEFSGSDGGRPDRESGQRHQKNSYERRDPHQVGRFQDPSESHSSQFNRPQGPGLNNGGKSFPSFDNPQNQQAVNPQRHRGALLPTPTEGLIRFPNPMIKSPDGMMTQKQMGHSNERDQSRGRPRNRHRGSVRGHGRRGRHNT